MTRGGLLALLLFFATLVCKVQHQVKGNDGEVEAVHTQYIVDLTAEELSGNAGYVSDDDRQHEYQALSAGGVGGQALVNGDRPG